MLRKSLLRALPSLFLMIIIFYFSSKTSTQSTADSNPLVELVAGSIQTITAFFGQKVHFTEQSLSVLSFLIRKLAHTAEYALLGCFLSFFFSSITASSRKRFLFALLTGFFYACSDELHQHFVPGRSCEVSDILIDTNGVLLGCLFYILLCRIIKHFATLRKS